METAHKRSFFVGVALLSVIFIAAKLLFFALPWAAELGKLGRGVFRELVIALNLFLGYRLMPNPVFQKQYLRVGIFLELCFLVFVALYAYLPSPPSLIAELQIMFRELLLSPIYFVVFYFVAIQGSAAAINNQG